jgi:glycerophosphoryl diester phosphodiesterase
MTPNTKQTEPLIIAHRGATAYAPENSYEAVEKAIELDLDAIEVDLRLTGDGHIVCFHDDNIMRITGLNRKISNITAKELRRIRLFFEGTSDNRFPQGRVLFLDDLLDLTKERILVNIELKGSNWTTEVLENKVLGAIQKRGMEKQILISSFFYNPLRRLQKMTAAVKTGLLIHPAHYRVRKTGRSSKWLDLHSIHPPYKIVTPERIAEWRDAGYAIYVWTVNEQNLYEKLTISGVDGIITDIPEELAGKEI